MALYTSQCPECGREFQNSHFRGLIFCSVACQVASRCDHEDDHGAPPPSAPSPSDTPYPQPARLETGAANAALDRVGGWVRWVAGRLVRK